MPRCCNDRDKTVDPVSGVIKKQSKKPWHSFLVNSINQDLTFHQNQNNFADDNDHRQNLNQYYQDQQPTNDLQCRKVVVEKSHRRLRCDLSPVPTTQNSGLSIKLLTVKVNFILIIMIYSNFVNILLGYFTNFDRKPHFSHSTSHFAVSFFNDSTIKLDEFL